MAINIGNSNYGGEVLEDLLAHAVRGNDTVDKGLIHIKSGIQFKYTLPTIKMNKVIQDNVDTPTSSNSKGDYDIGERELEPQDFMVYLEFNPRDFEKFWDFTQPENPLVFRELDPMVQATMFQMLIKQKNSEISEALWMSTKGGGVQGTATTSVDADVLGAGANKYYDGIMMRFLTSMRDDTAPEKVISAGTTVLDTGVKVESAFKAMYKKLPKAIRSNKKLLSFVTSYEVWDLYDEYLSDKQFKYTDNTRENVLSYKGIKIVPVNHVPEDTIALGQFDSTRDSNLWLGVDYANDSDIVKVAPLQNNSSKWFFQMRMKMDVNITLPGQIVLWSTYSRV